MSAINEIVTKEALEQLQNLIDKIRQADKAFLEMSAEGKKAFQAMATPPKTSDALNKQLKESQRLIRELQQDNKKQETALANLQKKYESLAQTKKTVNATDRQTIIDGRVIRRDLDEEAVKTSTLTTYIQKLSVDRAKASRIVADYNAQIAMGTALTEEQSAELAQATASFQKYDNAIKAGKKSIGDAREYVGQYERANWGLQNSVNQLTRELPALGMNASTFFLAISNNIGPFKDAINQIQAENAKLKADGKQITSVWNQLTSALFSWNTVLSVGATLLVVYGKEIGNWAKELFGAKTALEDLNKAQEDVNASAITGLKNSFNDVQATKSLLAVVKNTTLETKYRKEALSRLMETYPDYFKNIGKETELNEKVAASIERLYADFQKKETADELDKAIIKNKEKILELNQKITEIEKENPNLPSRQNIVKMADLMVTGDEQKYKDYVVEINGLYGINAEAQKEVNRLRGESAGLLIRQTKDTDDNTRSIKLNTKAREDYLASEYELWRLRKQNESDRNKEIMQDEASGYELRLMASEQYYENELDLANRAAQEELRVLAFTTDERIKTVNAEYQNRIKELDKYIKTEGANLKLANDERLKAIELLNYNITGINEDASRKQQIIEENKTRRIYDLNVEMIDKLKKEWDTINFGKAKIEIDQRSLDEIDKYVEKLKGLDIGLNPEVVKSSLEGIGQEFANANAKIAVSEATLSLNILEEERVRLKSRINALNKIRKLTDEQKDEQQKNNEALIKLDDDIIKSKQNVGNAVKSLSELEIQKALYVQQKKKEINEETKRLQYELYSSLKDLAGQLFENQISYYDREIEQSNKHYDALLENAEKGSEQEQLLQEEKAKREEDLQKRKVELQRKQAIFNKLIQVAEIVAETAKAVAKIQLEAAILKANPLTALLAANALAQIPFVLGTSAIQIATVMATPLPQYKDGRGKGKDEFAIVGDGGRSEVIERGSGKLEVTPNVPTITHLGKDDIVHKSLEDFERSKLAIQNASIMASFGSQSRQLEMFDYYLGKELRGISSKIEKGIEKGFKKAKIQNYIKIPPIDIGHIDYKNRGLT